MVDLKHRKRGFIEKPCENRSIFSLPQLPSQPLLYILHHHRHLSHHFRHQNPETCNENRKSSKIDIHIALIISCHTGAPMQRWSQARLLNKEVLGSISGSDKVLLGFSIWNFLVALTKSGFVPGCWQWGRSLLHGT